MTGGRRWMVLLLAAGIVVACNAESDLLRRRDGGAGGSGSGVGGASGAAGTGGSDGAAGSGGAGGVLGPIVGMPLATFDTTLDGLALYTDRDGVTSGTDFNIGGFTGLPRTEVSHDATAGSPTPGCLKLSVPYAGGRGSFTQVHAGVTGIQDWSGRILRVRIRLASGTFFGEARLFARTESFSHAWSTTRLPSDGSWKELALDVSSPSQAGFDARRIVGYGLELPGNGTTGRVDFQIDSFSLEQVLTPSDAGTD